MIDQLTREQVLEFLNDKGWPTEDVRAAVEAIYAENEQLSGVAEIYCDEAQKWSKVINDQRTEVERLRGELADAKRNKEIALEAFEEAFRRYPNSASAIMFLHIATGLGVVKLTEREAVDLAAALERERR